MQDHTSVGIQIDGSMAAAESIKHLKAVLESPHPHHISFRPVRTDPKTADTIFMFNVLTNNSGQYELFTLELSSQYIGKALSLAYMHGLAADKTTGLSDLLVEYVFDKVRSPQLPCFNLQVNDCNTPDLAFGVTASGTAVDKAVRDGIKIYPPKFTRLRPKADPPIREIP